MAVIGVFLVVAGLPLLVAPVAAGRFARQLRFVPYSESGPYVRLYRMAGVAMVAIGLVIVVLSL